MLYVISIPRSTQLMSQSSCNVSSTGHEEQGPSQLGAQANISTEGVSNIQLCRIDRA